MQDVLIDFRQTDNNLFSLNLPARHENMLQAKVAVKRVVRLFDRCKGVEIDPECF